MQTRAHTYTPIITWLILLTLRWTIQIPVVGATGKEQGTAKQDQSHSSSSVQAQLSKSLSIRLDLGLNCSCDTNFIILGKFLLFSVLWLSYPLTGNNDLYLDGLLRGFSGMMCIKHFEQSLEQSKLWLLLYYHFWRSYVLKRKYGLKQS